MFIFSHLKLYLRSFDLKFYDTHYVELGSGKRNLVPWRVWWQIRGSILRTHRLQTRVGIMIWLKCPPWFMITWAMGWWSTAIYQYFTRYGRCAQKIAVKGGGSTYPLLKFNWMWVGTWIWRGCQLKLGMPLDSNWVYWFNDGWISKDCWLKSDEQWMCSFPRVVGYMPIGLMRLIGVS